MYVTATSSDEALSPPPEQGWLGSEPVEQHRLRSMLWTELHELQIVSGIAGPQLCSMHSGSVSSSRWAAPLFVTESPRVRHHAS